MGTRNGGRFVGQEVTEGTCRHTYFRTRHLPGSRLNNLEFKTSLVQDWHSEIFSPFVVLVAITLSYPGVEMLLSSPGVLLVPRTVVPIKMGEFRDTLVLSGNFLKKSDSDYNMNGIPELPCGL